MNKAGRSYFGSRAKKTWKGENQECRSPKNSYFRTPFFGTFLPDVKKHCRTQPTSLACRSPAWAGLPQRSSQGHTDYPWHHITLHLDPSPMSIFFRVHFSFLRDLCFCRKTKDITWVLEQQVSECMWGLWYMNFPKNDITEQLETC